MSRKKYAGFMLVVVGLLLLVLGSALIWIKGDGLDEQQVEEVNSLDLDQAGNESNLVINLPAPGSIVGSPLLVRGRAYGGGRSVELQLKTGNGELIEQAVTEVREADVNNQTVSLWQTSLVFADYEIGQGWLEVRLLGEDGTISHTERIPLMLR